MVILIPGVEQIYFGLTKLITVYSWDYWLHMSFLGLFHLVDNVDQLKLTRMLEWIIMNIPENNHCRWQNYKRRLHEHGKYLTVNFFQNRVVSCDPSTKSNLHVLCNWSTTNLAKTWGGHPFLANLKTNNMCIFNILKCLNMYLKTSWVYIDF